MKVKGTDNVLELIKILRDGGADADPEVAMAIEFALQGDYSYLQELLTECPYILEEAKSKAFEKEAYVAEDPFWPPPQPDELQQINGPYSLGIVNHTGDTINLTFEDFTKGILFTGAMGTGKTYEKLKLMDQILKVPPNVRGFNVIFFQLVKNDADCFSLKYPWVKVLPWKNMRLNPFQVEWWDNPEDKLASILHIIMKINNLLDLSGTPLKYALGQSYKRNGVFDGSNYYPIFKDLLGPLQGYTKAFSIQGYEMTSTIGRVTNRIVNYIMEGEKLNTRIGMTTDDFLEHDLVLNFQKGGTPAKTVAMSLFVDLQRRQKKVLLDIEEARILFPRIEGNKGISVNDIEEEWFTTSRESGCGRILTSQEVESLAHYVISNSNIRISHPVYGKKSIDEVCGLHNLNEEQRAALPSLPPYGEAIMSRPMIDRPFRVWIPGDLELDKTQLHKVPAHNQPFINKLHKIIEERQPKFTKEENYQLHLARLRDGIKPYTMKLLTLLTEDPYLFKTRLKDKASIGDKDFKDSIKFLEDTKLIVTKSATLKTRPADFYALTNKAHDLLKSPPEVRKACPGPAQYVHAMKCDHIAIKLKSQGYEVTREYRHKSEEGSVRLDVFAEIDGKRTAFEVMHTDLYRLTITLDNAVNKMGMDDVVIVVNNQADKKSADKTIKETDVITEADKKKVRTAYLKELI